jgi:hypothetical protein
MARLILLPPRLGAILLTLLVTGCAPLGDWLTRRR